MLPELNKNGDLPPGVHVAGWTEIEQRFGTGTKARTRAFATLRRLQELARRTGSLQSLYVFGSFVSSAPEPRDVDVMLVMAREFKVEDCTWESRPLFSHRRAQGRYGASVFWLRQGMLPDAAMRDLLEGCQTKRGGTLRGILEVE
jgi:hypothetical protein